MLLSYSVVSSVLRLVNMQTLSGQTALRIAARALQNRTDGQRAKIASLLRECGGLEMDELDRYSQMEMDTDSSSDSDE